MVKIKEIRIKIELKHCQVCNQMTNHEVVINDYDDMVRTDYACLKCREKRKKVM